MKAFFILYVGLLWGVLFPFTVQAQSCEDLLDESARLYATYRTKTTLTPAELRTYIERLDAALACPDNRTSRRQAYLRYLKADVLLMADYFDTARQTISAFFEAYPTLEDSIYVSKLYWLRGYIHFLTGQYQPMIHDYAEALTLLPRTPAYLQERFDLLISLSATYRHIYQYTESARLLQRARQLLLAHPDLQTPENRATLLQHMIDLFLHAPSDALEGLPVDTAFYARALEEIKDIFRDHPEKASVLLLEGELLERQDDLLRAYQHYRQAYVEALRHGRERYAIEALLNQARLAYVLRHPPAEVESLLLQALDLARRAPVEFRAVHTALGQWYESQGQFPRARDHYQKAIQYLEDSLLRMSVSDWVVQVFDPWQEAYRGLVRIHLREGAYTRALLTLEQTRARQLRLLRQQVRIRFTLSDEARAEVARNATRIRELQLLLLQDTLSVDTRATLQAELISLANRQRQLLSVTEPEPLRLSAVRQTLRAGHRMALVYFLDRTRRTFSSPPVSHIFAVSEDTLLAIPLNLTEDSLETFFSRLPGVAMTGTGELSRTQVDMHLLHELHRILLAPVETRTHLPPALTLVPDGVLSRLPFSMLVHTPASSYTPSAFLLYRHAVSYAPGLSFLQPGTSYHEPALDLLALGRSRFTDLPDSSLRALPPLPGVEQELALLRSLFRRARTFLNEAATEQVLLTYGPRASIVHVASHTLINERQPLQTFVVLSPDSGEARSDGRLHMYELQQRPFPVSLVVLSSCNTAAGSLMHGEGLLGLQYAFLAAGAEGTLASLWPVSDASWQFLMSRFYRYLKRGTPRDEAWRQARLDYLEAHPDILRSPFFWASGLLYGPPTPVFSGTVPAGYLYPLLGLLLLFAGLLIRRRLRRTNHA